ncbi:hypothetical protein V6N12_030171 [Hibiscus sabdariffa]|uniref:Uncharacterized protein n=1 Tax=Hibiscus sabdariffa TaxID=183260 RepID=A0ABR2C1L6_9ROSI
MSSTNTTRIIVPSPTVTEEPSQLPIQQPAVSVAAEPSIWSSPQSDTCVIPADLDASAMVQSPEELFGVLPLSNQGAVPGAGGAGNEEEIAAMSSNMESVHTEHVLDSHPLGWRAGLYLPDQTLVRCEATTNATGLPHKGSLNHRLDTQNKKTIPK